jgi:hypothetical protein
MWTVLASREAFLVYGAAIGWGLTHWTAVKTAEAAVQQLFTKAQTAPAAVLAAAPKPPGA